MEAKCISGKIITLAPTLIARPIVCYGVSSRSNNSQKKVVEVISREKWGGGILGHILRSFPSQKETLLSLAKFL